MQIPLVLTVIGADRPGLVEKVADLVAGHGGNWLESRMCRLGGQFAGIVQIVVPTERQAALTTAFAGLSAQGLRIAVYADSTSPVPVADSLARIELVGQDRPGIVRQVAAVLAAQGVNVEDLTTQCISAPMSGETLFQARARLHLPAGCDVPRLRQDLERIASDLLVDITFEPMASGK
jgi:glycine cleavage system regulatory protein